MSQFSVARSFPVEGWHREGLPPLALELWNER